MKTSVFRYVLIAGVLLMSLLLARGGTVTANFTSAGVVPVTASSYTATGNTVVITLGFAPPVGTTLTVVNNTGTSAIQGVFDNLAQGQVVNLSYNGIIYPFVASYFGGTGNDMVLLWGNTRLLGWGANDWYQLGNPSLYTGSVPVPLDMSGVLAGKRVVALGGGGNYSIVLCADGTLAGWGYMNPAQTLVDRSGVLAGKTVVAIAAGESHTLALCADGSLAAWGSNTYGELGNRSTIAATSPVAVDQTGVLAGRRVIAIAAGYDASFALCDDGAVAAWGDNATGQLGNNNTGNSAMPTLVYQAGVLAGRKIIALSCSASHTLVMCADGTVAAWGLNQYGELGNNTTTNSNVPVAVTQTGVLAGKTIVALAAGCYHSMVLCSDGKLAAWGSNSNGQLGNNTTTNSSVPVAVTQSGVLAAKTVTAIFTGAFHSLAFCSDGTVASWGNNPDGELGNGSTTYSSVPVTVNRSALTTGENIQLVAAGYQHNLALVVSPPPPVAITLAATGITDTGVTLRGTANANGASTTVSFEYGPDSSYGTTVAASPATVTGANPTTASATLSGLPCDTTWHYRIVTTSAGGTVKGADMTITTSTLATLSSLTPNTGSLVPAFSSKTMAYLITVPYSTATLTLTPVVANPGATVTVANVTVTSGSPSAPQALAVGATRIDTKVTAAGGGNTQTYSVTVTRLPQTITYNSAADVGVTVAGFVAAGDVPPIVLNYAPTPGTRLTVINNTGSGIIQGSFGNLTQSQIISLTYGGIIYPFVVNYYGGTGNDLVLQWANTRLMDWGNNNFGQLGNNNTANSSFPVPVDTGGVLAGRTILTLATGDQNSLALCADSTLAAWGNNGYGQLGNNSTTNAYTPVAVDRSGILAGKTVVAIASGGCHNLALCADGALAAWGFNDGNMGNNTTANSYVPVWVDQTGVLAGKSIASIATGDNHCLVLCSDGTLATWGYDNYGQLGNNSYSNTLVPVLVDRSGVLAGKSVIAIAAGLNHNLALCSDGTLVSWGDNSWGQLGINTTNSSSVPVLVTQTGALAGKTITAIAAGDSHSLVLCADGTLAAWGYNYYGQLGNNSTTTSYVPVLVTRTGVLSGKTVTAVAAGNYHCLALCADGSLATWGYNNYGELGNNSTTYSSVPVLTSTSPLRAGERFIMAVGAYEHSHAMVASPLVPVATTLAASAISDTTATLNATVNGQGNTATVTFEYGITTSYGSTLTATPASVSGTAATAVSATASALPPGTTMHFRVVAAGLGGTVAGSDMTFTTGTAATLAELSLSDGTLTPGFDPKRLNYFASVANTVGSVTLTPVAATAGSVITINGVTVASGSPCAPLTLPVGETAISIQVTAPDGVNTVSYALKVTRLPQSFTYNSAVDVPLTVSGFSGAGCPVSIVLNHVPVPGTVLTMVRNTGVMPIQGYFPNLAQSQKVYLTYGAGTYVFVANYFGGTGNDLVLQWANNRLLAWGNNASGSLGNGTANSTAAVPTPVKMDGVLAGKTVMAVAMGASHVIALCADGTLAAWGKNGDGQLGNGGSTNSNVPVLVDRSGVLAGKTVVALAAGLNHSLALCADGALVSWGRNDYGQLGTSGMVSSAVPVAVDQSGVLAGKTIVGLAAGASVSMVLCGDGTVATWGYNGDGELGNSTISNSSVPVLVTRTGVLAGKTVIAIGTENSHSLALCSDGTLVGWGINAFGQLGNNSTTNSNVPVQVTQTGVLAGETLTAVAAGGSHSLVLCADGTLAAWGDNSNCCLGNRGSTSSSVPVLTYLAGALAGKTVSAIAAGGYHNLALCADGSLVSWGYNIYSQLGDNTTSTRNEPVLVNATALNAGERVMAAGCGQYFSLCTVAMPPPPAAITSASSNIADQSAQLNGSVNACGVNFNVNVSFDYGLTTSYGSSIAATPAIATGTAATTVGATLNNLLPGTTYHFRVVAAGAGGRATGDDMTFTTTAHAALNGLTVAGANLTPVFVSTTDHYGAAVSYATSAVTMTPVAADPSATVRISGITVASGTASAPVPLLVGENTIPVTVAAADGINNHAYSVTVVRLPAAITFNSTTDVPVITSSMIATGILPDMSLNFAPPVGSALTVVRNTGSKPILGTFGNLAPGQRVQLTYQGLTYDFVANYFGGTGNDLVLQWANTRLLAWGSNSNGQLGDGTTTQRNIPTVVDMSGVLAGKTVVMLANGYLHSLALCSDGTLAAWGYNGSGQLGNGSQNDSSVPVAVDRTGVLAGRTVVAIATSGSHCLALCADGVLAEWGLYFTGLGTNLSTVPAAVDQTGALAGKTVTAIAVGDGHSLVMCSDGSLATWGYNDRSQLGNNSTLNSSVPIPLGGSGALAGKSATSIAAGAWHNLVVCSDGTVVTWGYNYYGQLGNSAFTDSNVPVTLTQTGVLAGKSVTAVAGGGYHSLALCSDGTLYAWGSDSNGQLGNGGTGSSSAPLLVNPVGALAGRTVMTVSGGGYHSLVRCSDGVTSAWGSGVYGQLGNSTTSDSGLPLGVLTDIPMTTGERVIAAVAGSRHNTAVVATPPPPVITTLPATSILNTSAVIRGSVIANGADRAVSFQYGTSTSYGNVAAATPGTVGGTTQSVDIAASLSGLLTGTTYHYRVVATAGTVTSVSADMTFTTDNKGTLTDLLLDHGLLYPAFTEGQSTYTVTLPFGTDSLAMTPVAANSSASIAVNGVTTPSGTAAGPFGLMVGENDFAIEVADMDGIHFAIYFVKVTRLPSAITYNSSADVPLVVSDLTAAGDAPALMLNHVPVPGACLTVIRNIGRNPIHGEFANLASGQMVYLTYGGASYAFVANYFGGTGNDLVLQWANTRVLSWGYNAYGELGNTTTTNSGFPGPVDTSGVLAGKTVTAIASGGMHSLALCADETLVSWGYNSSGQLGNGGIGNSNSSPVRVKLDGILAGKRVVAMACGYAHSLALCSDGTLAAWGGNTLGQLGNNTATTITYSSAPVAVDQTGVLAGKSVIAIACGTNHCMVLCADGTLAAWGDNSSGQLGNNSTTNSSVPVPVNQSGVLAGRTVTAIAGVGDHALALCADGAVAAWGNNGDGRLGNNSTTNSSVPVWVDRSGVLANRSVAAIAAGSANSLALCVDGTMVAWGNNGSGSLGNNSTTTSYVPVYVDQSGVLAGKSVGAIGNYGGLALCTDGTMASWGDNTYGQLGNFDTTASSVPVSVLTNMNSLVSGMRTMAITGGASKLALAAFPMPAAAVLPATSVTATSATMNGLANGGGNTNTVAIEYGPTIAYGSTVASSPASASGESAINVSANITGLPPGSTWHYRVVVGTGSGVTVRSDDMTFATLSNNAMLSSLSLSAGSIVPAFNQDITSYRATVSNATGIVTVTPVTAQAGASVKINGTSVAGGTPSAPITLTAGTSTTITALVTAEDGITTRSYAIAVTRLLPELADPDHDGIPNLLEYAFGLDPAANNTGQLPQPVVTGGNVVVRFTEPPGVAGIIYGAQWSATLLPGSWTDVPDTGASPEHIFSVPAIPPRVFMRLKVTVP